MDAKLGLCTIADKEASVETVIAAAAGAGYDGVEVWGRDHLGDGSAATLDGVREAADEHGVAIPVYGSYLRAGAGGFDDDLDAELGIAERLGADLVRVWAGDDDYAERTPEGWDAAVADLRTAADRAADRDLGLVVERHRGSFTDATEGARRLIEAVDRPNCGLNWQPNFDNPAGEVVASARELAGLSDNVHLQTVPEPGSFERCPLAEGYYDVSAVLEAFDAAGFEGHFEVEFVADGPFDERIRADREYLADLL